MVCWEQQYKWQNEAIFMLLLSSQKDGLLNDLFPSWKSVVAYGRAVNTS